MLCNIINTNSMGNGLKNKAIRENTENVSTLIYKARLCECGGRELNTTKGSTV